MNIYIYIYRAQFWHAAMLRYQYVTSNVQNQNLNNKQRLTIAASGILAIRRSSTDLPSTSRTFMHDCHVL